MTSTVTVTVPPRSLVVLAGLPGAGKTTLLKRLDTGGERATVLDSDQVRAVLPEVVPYRYLRPLVHLAHRARILLRAIGSTGLLVVHEPSTRSTTRAALVAVGTLTRRHTHFVWLDTAAEDALRGQVTRGRVVRGRSFARHVRRAEGLRERFASGRRPRGWQGLHLLNRGEDLHLSVTSR